MRATHNGDEISQTNLDERNRIYSCILCTKVKKENVISENEEKKKRALYSALRVL